MSWRGSQGLQPSDQRPLSQHRACVLCSGLVAALWGLPSLSQAQPSRQAPRPESRPEGKVEQKPEQKPEQKLARAKLAYLRGDYGAAVLLLRPLLYPETLLAVEDQVILAHKLLAISAFFEHDEAAAEQEFNLLLSLRPDFALDPVVDPLQVVAFLDDIRRRNTERLQEIRRRQAEEEQRRRTEAEALQKQAELLAAQRTRRIYIERVVHRRFSVVDLVPFGVPQLLAKRRAVGASLLLGQVLSGSGSLATWLSVRLLYPEGRVPNGQLKTAQALTGVYLGTGALFWGLVLTGLIDALVHARTIVEVRELSAPPADLPATTPGTSPAQPAAPQSLFFPARSPERTTAMLHIEPQIVIAPEASPVLQPSLRMGLPATTSESTVSGLFLAGLRGSF
ncbi:MAG: hypothetical protein JNJ46_02955 [Myxococcales bacterium]|nr:hypothetical protein [Myxococcales bacterium]